jgi:hypothetical protein
MASGNSSNLTKENQMHHDITAEDILQIYNRKNQKAGPGLAYDISARTNIPRSREQLNNKTIKELNNSSRNNSEDVMSEQSPLTQTPSSVVVQKDVGSVITPRDVSSRYSCVQVQHCRTAKGVKLAITLQTPELKRLRVTAELKRYDRLREVKTRLEDSSKFNMFFEDTKQAIYAAKNRNVCMGRLHARGKRSQWFRDTLVVGVLNNAGIIDHVIININHEEYAVDLNGELTDLQTRMYLATGQYGVFQSSKAMPRIEDADWEDC